MTAEHGHERVAEWDAAYVLGALTPDDRREFEAHLAACKPCRAAVAEIGPVAGLLSRVPAERARALSAQPAAAPRGTEEALAPDVRPAAGSRGFPEALAPEPRSLAPRRTRRRWGWWFVGAAAAAIALIAAIAVPMALSAPRSDVYALSELADVPLEASVRLTDAAWGTRIDLVCRYTGEVLDAPDGGWPYALAVVDAEGATTTLSTWRATPGSTTQLSAGTDLTVGDIGAVEIRTVDGTAVLMRYDAE